MLQITPECHWQWNRVSVLFIFLALLTARPYVCIYTIHIYKGFSSRSFLGLPAGDVSSSLTYHLGTVWNYSLMSRKRLEIPITKKHFWMAKISRLLTTPLEEGNNGIGPALAPMERGALQDRWLQSHRRLAYVTVRQGFRCMAPLF